MATVADNVLIDGLRGRFGDSLVFKTMRGKTFVTSPARKPDRLKESTAQRSTRTNFRQATEWAQQILLHPDKKAYYSKCAKTLKLPNAYTAALTDFMRKPKVNTGNSYDNTITCTVSKKDFQLKKVEIVIPKAEGEEVRAVTTSSGRWIFKLLKDDINERNYIRVIDEAERETIIMLMAVF